MEKILAVKKLEKRFQLHLLDGRIIEPLHGVSFEVEQGQVFIISGRSGAGKTSILKCIYRTYLTSSGEIRYNSQQFGPLDIASASEEVIIELREHELGYCAQFLKVLPRVSALDVAAEPLIRRGMRRADAQAEAALWLGRLAIEESRWQAYPVTFSGGEQQRLNLARAFIAAPRLLLLDEPTSSLDPKSKEIVLNMISDAKKAGVTILTVSHDLPSLSALADATYVLQPGNPELEVVQEPVAS